MTATVIDRAADFAIKRVVNDTARAVRACAELSAETQALLRKTNATRQRIAATLATWPEERTG